MMACNLPQKSIMLTQGDDSNAMGHYIKITFSSQLDLSGWYALVQLANFQWKLTDLDAGTIEWVIPRSITAQLSVGAMSASIKIFDSNDLCRTTMRNIPVYVNAITVQNPEIRE